jgi:hypothetical protein
VNRCRRCGRAIVDPIRFGGLGQVCAEIVGYSVAPVARVVRVKSAAVNGVVETQLAFNWEDE